MGGGDTVPEEETMQGARIENCEASVFRVVMSEDATVNDAKAALEIFKGSNANGTAYIVGPGATVGPGSVIKNCTASCFSLKL